MAEETDKNSKDRTKSKTVLWWIYLLIGFVASVVVGSMSYIFYVGNHITVVHAPLICAAMEIRIEVTTAHLWLEEILSGDRQESIDAVRGHLDEADWYAQAMLEGGENPHWKYSPLDDVGIRLKVENFQVKLAEFRAITEERFRTPADSSAGSEIDQKYDGVFAELMNMTEQVEVNIKQMIGRELRNFQVLQTFLILICVVLTVLVGAVFSRFIHRQVRYALQLHAANQQLDASNQQLRASEQQLKAANQQLTASEQQLKAANQQLIASQEEIQSLANFPSENSNPVLRIAKDGIVLYSNEAGMPLLTAWGTQMGRRLPDKWRKFAADVFGSGSSKETEYDYDDHVLSLTFTPVVDLGYVNVYGLDITKRKKAADAIQKQREEFHIIFDSVPAGIWYKDAENRLVRVNKAAAKSISMKPEDIEGKKTCDIFPQEDAEHYYKDDLEVIKSGKPKWGIIEEMQVPGGEKKWVRTDKVPYRDEQGNVSGVIVFVMDITEQKRAEQQLRTSLEEKEVLLREIHHRVKNNLQIIVSLLSLQSEYVQDEQAVELFRESQFRVKSMALLHERLYETEDLAHINFSDYIRDLTNELLSSYGADAGNIKLKIDVENVFPSIEVAVPCALIINELVSNCLKHAFPKGRSGEIRIEFDLDKRDNYTLSISDNGAGFLEDVDFPNGETLGLQLVSTLVKQLEGTVVLDKSVGTSFKISFSKLQ